MNRTAKLLVIGSLIFLVAGCSSQKNQTSSNQEKPANSAKEKPSNGEKTMPTYYELLVDMDANNDGKLSSMEVSGPLKENFDAIDTNGDGFLNQSEIENAPKPQKGSQGGPPRGGQGGPQR